MQCAEVKEYYDILAKKKLSLKLKRAFDIVAGVGILVITAIPMLIISIKIATESSGGVLYRQERITRYGKKFRIHKFRTMVANADKIGSAVTISGDSRITPTGAFLRKYRLDELPQVFDVLAGNMSFVGDGGIIETTRKNLDFTQVWMLELSLVMKLLCDLGSFKSQNLKSRGLLGYA